MSDRPTDWRGNEIGVYTRVIYARDGYWRIGTVTEVRRKVDIYRTWQGLNERVSWLLDIEWQEQSGYVNQSGKARGVIPERVTVFREGPN